MDDSISRQAAIDALARMMPRSYTPDGSHPADEEIFRAQEVFADCIEALEILPSVQPEPKEGHWKKDETDDCPPVFRQFRICSVCGAIETSETNYCPNCGARMTNK